MKVNMRNFPNIERYFERGSYFINRSYEHILSGFFLDISKRNIYVYKFVYPLFEPSKEIHLTYSERLGGIEFEPDMYANLRKVLDDNNIDQFCGLSLLDFIGYLNSSEGGLNNVHVKRAVAFGYALAGDIPKAEELAKTLLSTNAYALQPHFKESVDLFLSKIGNESDVCKYLDGLEQENRAKFKLADSTAKCITGLSS